MTNHPKRSNDSEKKSYWGLALVANPYARVCVIRVTDAGRVQKHRSAFDTGQKDEQGERILRTRLIAETYDPSQPGGMYSTMSYRPLDLTPRGWDEACRIANLATAGRGYPLGLTMEEAMEGIARATATR